MSRERIIQEEILTSVMREMQKDFYDDKWWENKKVDKLPLLLGIWEFKEEALDLGFTIGMSLKVCHIDGAFNREMASAVFIEEALIGFYIEGVQITGVFLTHSFFDRYQKGKFIEEKQMNKKTGYYNSVWYRIERFFDRHNHLMEFIRTILALMVLCMQFYILTRLG